jgi:hypothetical protein
VNGEVCLAVAVEIASAKGNAALDWRFENAGFDAVAVPVDGLREANLEGEDFGGHKEFYRVAENLKKKQSSADASKDEMSQGR